MCGFARQLEAWRDGYGERDHSCDSACSFESFRDEPFPCHASRVSRVVAPPGLHVLSGNALQLDDGQLPSASSATAAYVTSLYSGRPLALFGSQYWYLTDANGVPSGLTNQLAAIQERYWESPSGQPDCWTPFGYPPKNDVWSGGKVFDGNIKAFLLGDGRWLSTVLGEQASGAADAYAAKGKGASKGELMGKTGKPVKIGKPGKPDPGGSLAPAGPSDAGTPVPQQGPCTSDDLSPRTFVFVSAVEDELRFVIGGEGHAASRGVEATVVQDIADMHRHLIEDVGPCECVAEVTIYDHGDPGIQLVGEGWIQYDSDISNAFSDVKWCRPCLIDLGGCNVAARNNRGEDLRLPNRIAEFTRCTVEANRSIEKPWVWWVFYLGESGGDSIRVSPEEQDNK